MPEMLPGAQPSANPTQREHFEERCKRLHKQEEAEWQEEVEHAREVSGTSAALRDNELEAMFPNLDAELVRAIRADAPNAQGAIEVLLALSASAAEVDSGGAATSMPELPPREVGVEDHEQFPSLVDAGGWQVPSGRAFDLAGKTPEELEDLGSAWRDQAQAVADVPGPAPQRPQGVTAWGAPVRQRRPKDGEVDAVVAASAGPPERPQPPTDYDMRQRVGQRRARQKALYSGRGGRKPVGPSTRPGGGCAPRGWGQADEGEESRSDDDGDVPPADGGGDDQ